MIYLDHAASAPLRPEARDAMLAVLDGQVGNASATHRAGQAAAAPIARAGAELADAIGARPDELVWTSGATESINTALCGVARFAAQGRDTTREPVRIVSCVTEHAATRDTLRALAAEGVHVNWLDVDREGRLDVAALETALASAPDLVSLMQVNNETGVVHDIPAITERCQAAGVALHVDAAQSLGRLAIDVAATPIALMSMSAHKLGGPVGIGALYVRRRPRVGLAPLMIGGGQQQGRRAGTLAGHQIAGFGAAVAAACAQRKAEQAQYAAWRDRLWAAIHDIEGVTRNGRAADVAAPFLNVSVAGVHGEALRTGLAEGEPALAISGGSACSAARGESSYVLRAMGRLPAEAAASIRFSLGPGLDVAAIDAAARRFGDEIRRLRDLAAAA